MKVPVKIVVPLIFCILPTLFIAVLGPAAISIMNGLMAKDMIRPAGRYVGVGGIARAFALMAIAVPAAWSLDLYALVGLLALAIVWIAAMTVAGALQVPRWIALMVESGRWAASWEHPFRTPCC